MAFKISLGKGQNKKSYSVPSFSLWVYKQTVEMHEEIGDKKAGLEEIEIMCGYLTSVFENQFTIEDVMKGLTKTELLDLIGKMFSMIIYDLTEEQVEEALKARETEEETEEGK